MLVDGSVHCIMEKKEKWGNCMDQNLLLRQAVPDDAARIIAYLNEVAGESDNLMFGRGEFTITLEQEKELLQQTLQSTRDLFLVAEMDGQIVGTLTFFCGKRNRNRHVGEFGMNVMRAYWGKGIGKSMLQHLIKWAKESGEVRKINLRVRSDNERAIRLYNGLGFVEEGVLRREICIAGQFYDTVAMGLLLD